MSQYHNQGAPCVTNTPPNTTESQADGALAHTHQNLLQSSQVLQHIVASKAAHIAALKQRFPEASLQPKISDRSLFAALNTAKAGFILECKKASPSKGVIREQFNIEAIATIYARYSAAISVLTDEQFFQGNMDYLPQVRAQVIQPILCKDFFVDPYQVKLAAHQGADAILLMLSILDDQQYRQLSTLAATYQLDILTEVSNTQELQRAIALDAAIIGINNRNLRDLTTDLTTTEQLAPMVPANRLVISESGIYTHGHVRQLRALTSTAPDQTDVTTQAGRPIVNGFLVGSSLMAETDIDLACRKLIFGHNKVCGLTRLEDIAAAARAGAIYAGLIFAPSSPRALTLEQAQQRVNDYRMHYAPQTDIGFVGVFVNADIQHISQVAHRLKLAAVQLHGHENAADICALRRLFTAAKLNTEIWKAISVSTQTNKVTERPLGADRYLYDSKTDAKFGGTSMPFNWAVIIPNKAAAFLAGGLTPENAHHASTQGFYGLDFNSGLETAAGVKSHQAINQAFATLAC